MLKPLGDRVIIELVQAEEKTASGIVLPDTAKEKPQEGKVIAVGTGRVLENGERVALEVAAGDLIIFSKYAGTEVKYEGTDYLILRESDILAIIYILKIQGGQLLWQKILNLVKKHVVRCFAVSTLLQTQ
jgi:chaperonin GroES